MDYAHKLEQLEHLNDLVGEYMPLMYSSSDEHRLLHQQICELYGQVADVFEETVGRQRIDVPDARGGPSSTYPNFFEAGFLSGRSIHTHQGHTQLLKVIGKVQALSRQEGQVARPELAPGDRIFLVHGQDEAVLQSCARLLEKLGLPTTILREQPNQGRTIIEKFIDHADVGFAVVLLTGDDRGGPKGAKVLEQNLRARQNVILELGFFLGTLGRDRVCALYEEGVEIPSDYAGVAFVPLDTRMAWHIEVAREIKAAGFDVDLNKVV